MDFLSSSSSSSSSSTRSPSPAIDDCVKLLKGEKDEQKLAGLLLATRLCKGEDEESVQRIYDAVGFKFLDRLLRTGLRKDGADGKDEDREAFLKLAVTIIAGFCRVQQIAASEDIQSMIPIFLEILKNKSELFLIEECYEFLFLTANASQNGVRVLFGAGAVTTFSSQLSSLPSDSRPLELCLRSISVMLNKLPPEMVVRQHPEELALLVVRIARPFALLHTSLKFDMLHTLSAILSFDHLESLECALKSRSSDGTWGAYIAAGVVAILQSRVAFTEKLDALVVAESLMSIFGERWLIDQLLLPDVEPIPDDRCLLLVLETSRIEVAVLLNELAYMKYEACKTASDVFLHNDPFKQRNLGIAYCLIEKIIKLVASLCDSKDGALRERTMTKAMSGITETINVIFDYLQDAKDHGVHRGDDLLASVRIVGCYLAETPFAFREKVMELLQFILSVEGETEQSAFHAICFMLPMLYQTTTELEYCRILSSFGGHKLVVQFTKLIAHNSEMSNEDVDAISLACKTLLNVLLKKEDIHMHLDMEDITNLLQAIPKLPGCAGESFDIVASSICALLFDLTSEEALFSHGFEPQMYDYLVKLILTSLERCQEVKFSSVKESELDPHVIVTEGFARWGDRFPLIKQAILTSVPLQQHRICEEGKQM